MQNMSFESRIMTGLFIMARHLENHLEQLAWEDGRTVDEIVVDESGSGYARRYEAVEKLVKDLRESRFCQDVMLFPSEFVAPSFLRDLLTHAVEHIIPSKAEVGTVRYTPAVERLLDDRQPGPEDKREPRLSEYAGFVANAIRCFDRSWEDVQVSRHALDYMEVWRHCFEANNVPGNAIFNGWYPNGIHLNAIYSGESYNGYGEMAARQALPAEGLVRCLRDSTVSKARTGIMDASKDNDDAWKMYMAMRGFPVGVKETKRDEVYEMLSAIPGSVINPHNEAMCRNIFYLCVNAAWHFRHADDAPNVARFADIYLEKHSFDFADLHDDFGLAEFIFAMPREMIDRDALLEPMNTDWDNKVFLIYKIREIVVDEMTDAGLIV